MNKRRINMVFKENREGNTSLAFLQRVKPKSKSTLVAVLICNFLAEYGIKTVDDIESLEQSQIDYMANNCINGFQNNSHMATDLVEIIKSLVKNDNISLNSNLQSSPVMEERVEAAVKKEVPKSLVHDYDEEVFDDDMVDNDLDSDDDMLEALSSFM